MEGGYLLRPLLCTPLRRALRCGEGGGQGVLRPLVCTLTCTQSPELAFQWLQLGAEKESASAQFGLACLYLGGHFVDEDHDKAFKLFSKVRCGQGGGGS